MLPLGLHAEWPARSLVYSAHAHIGSVFISRAARRAGQTLSHGHQVLFQCYVFLTVKRLASFL